MATWPEFAIIQEDQYGEEADFGVLRSDMDSGLAKQRARFSIPIITRSVTVLVDGYENKRLFDEWFDVELKGGVLWFDFEDCVSGNTVQGRLVEGKFRWDNVRGQAWTGTCEIESIGR